MNDKAIHLPTAMVQAIGSVADMVGDTQYSVISEYPAHLPAVEGDEARLSRVIANLVAYIVCTTKHDEVRVRADLVSAGEQLGAMGVSEEKVRELEQRSPWVVVSVANVSPTVVLETVPIQIDEVKASNDRDPIVIGLEECVEFSNEIGGHFWLQHNDELGTRLQIALPLRATQVSGADVSHLRRLVERRLPEGDQESSTMLVMVEDQNIRELLHNELTTAGYKILEANNGGDVVPMAKENQPDLILLDLLARDPAAMDIALVLKHGRRTQHIPLIFLTTTTDSSGSIRMGAANFLVRPVGTGALLATVRAVLHSGLSPTTRVLVVEPDEVARENMVMMIQAHGYRVTVATGPEEALVLAERVNPGLVLVNVLLAQERDYWLLRGLRQLSQESNIFVLADALSEEEGKAAMSRGASGYSDTGKLSDLLNRVKGEENS